METTVVRISIYKYTQTAFRIFIYPRPQGSEKNKDNFKFKIQTLKLKAENVCRGSENVCRGSISHLTFWRFEIFEMVDSREKYFSVVVCISIYTYKFLKHEWRPIYTL